MRLIVLTSSDSCQSRRPLDDASHLKKTRTYRRKSPARAHIQSNVCVCEEDRAIKNRCEQCNLNCAMLFRECGHITSQQLRRLGFLDQSFMLCKKDASSNLEHEERVVNDW